MGRAEREEDMRERDACLGCCVSCGTPFLVPKASEISSELKEIVWQACADDELTDLQWIPVHRGPLLGEVLGQCGEGCGAVSGGDWAASVEFALACTEVYSVFGVGIPVCQPPRDSAFPMCLGCYGLRATCDAMVEDAKKLVLRQQGQTLLYKRVYGEADMWVLRTCTQVAGIVARLDAGKECASDSRRWRLGGLLRFFCGYFIYHLRAMAGDAPRACFREWFLHTFRRQMYEADFDPRLFFCGGRADGENAVLAAVHAMLTMCEAYSARAFSERDARWRAQVPCLWGLEWGMRGFFADHGHMHESVKVAVAGDMMRNLKA